MPQLFDGHIPLATSDLMLIIEIDLSDVPDWTRLRTLDHSAALRDALAATQLYPPADAPVVCRAHTTDGPATVSVAQALPHVDDPWCQDPAHRVRIEFLYSTTQPQLAIRIINHLPYSDGVTAVRTAFHTLEAFEGGKDAVGNGGEAFKKNPPFTFGPAHMLNMATVLGGGAAKALWPFTAPVSATEAAAPTTSAGLRAYYRTADAKPSAMRWYRAPANASPNATYKALVEALQAWGDRVGWKGFFTLLNFSPVAAASIVPKAADLTSIEKRYAGTFVPPGGPSGGRHWTVFNYIHVELCTFNNYGRHAVNTKGRVTAFTHDWMGLCAPVIIAGCITVNGAFLAWTRWTEAGLRDNEDLLVPVLGESLGQVWQAPV